MTHYEKGFKNAKVVGAKVDLSTSITTKTVNVAAGSASGTATVAAGSTVAGWYPAGNIDQTVKNIAISGTTLTVTLSANATAINNVKVLVFEP